METNDLKADVFTYGLLNKVNEQVLNWDLEAKTGKAFYNKPRSKAYLEIKMYKALGETWDGSHVIWNTPDAEIINYHENYRSDVEKALTFFLKYIAALKGKRTDLIFEINNAAFDLSSDRFNPFEKAVIHAIINCFDGEEAPKYWPEIVKDLKGGLKQQFSDDSQHGK
ncbi:hypothetical protein ACVW0P_004087 [Mucilaginibacter sp. UYNi724]